MPQSYTRITYIYALVDPDDGVVRYVGKADHPSQRMLEHLREFNLSSASRANDWLKRLLTEGKVPCLRVLQVVAYAVWQLAERSWMSRTPTALNAKAGGGGTHAQASLPRHYPGELFVCEECRKTFALYYSRLEAPRFCGRACYYINYARCGKPPIEPYSLDRAFWSKVEKTSTCWLWLGYRSRGGYGQMCYQGKPQSAYRFSYELHNGPIPEGLEIDHLCRNRLCVRPDHLQPVTSQENNRRGMSPTAINIRKTHCNRGHELNDVNCRVTPDGRRVCRVCLRMHTKAYKARKRAECRNQRADISRASQCS